MGWRGRSRWPGHGPYSDLPPWERPGWLYGRGACWRYPALSARTGSLPRYYPSTTTPQEEADLLGAHKTALEEDLKAIQEELSRTEDRLKELKK
jgi:hypothetical protein